MAVDADVDLSLLDREKQATHYLTFEAEDGGGLRETRPLTIDLSDVNDNPPQIGRDLYEGYVQENALTLERQLLIDVNTNSRFFEFLHFLVHVFL